MSHWTGPGLQADQILGMAVAGLTMIDRETGGEQSANTDVLRDLLAKLDELITELELAL